MKNRSDRTLVHDLRELIAAIDRRVPRLECQGETGVALYRPVPQVQRVGELPARGAAPLRTEATKRIETIEREVEARSVSNG